MGVVSEKDFLKKMGAGQTESFMAVIAQCLSTKGCVAKPMGQAGIQDLMSAPAITAGPDTSIAEISALFLTRRINRLPIVDKEGQPIGIVARSDLVKSYCMITA